MSSNTNKKKIIGTRMPLAVPFMILLNSQDLKMSDVRLKRLISPIYNCNAFNSENKNVFNNVSEQLFNNTGNIVGYYECDELYQEILNTIKDYNFSALLKYFAYYYNCDLEKIISIDDLKKCYKIMVDYRTNIKAISYTKDFCWKIAKLFLPQIDCVQNFNSLNKLYLKRKEMVKDSIDTIYIAGTTLKEAFSTALEHKEASIIYELFNNPNIKTINIFLLNYVYVGVSYETASNEIICSIENIFNKIIEAETPPKVNIVLLNNFSISFSLLTSTNLMTRSTHLFTNERCFRGQYLLFDKSDDKFSEYKAQKAYFDYLLEKSYDIDIDSKKESLYPIKKRMKTNNKLNCFVKLKKIHPVQLENIVRSSFVTHHEKNNTDFSKYLNNDQTQKVLIPYLQQTEELLEKVVKLHDKAGWAKIIPSFDLGFPNNVTRIAGGFLTGALYDWSCSVPLVPIDATVNTCTSSVFKLKNFNTNMKNEEFHDIIKELCNRALDNGYAFNFRSGNHFLMVAVDDNGNYYLVLHSSAKESKDSCFGLYPSKRAWFNENIKTEFNEDGNRYLRYIRGDAAIRFIDYSNRFREFNEEIHQFVANEFANLCQTTLANSIPLIKHHYEMPTASSVAIGTFVVNIYSNNCTVPIFSDYGKDVCLFKLSSKQKWTYKMAGTTNEVVLIPHGWGQVIDNIQNLSIKGMKKEDQRKLILSGKDYVESYPILPNIHLEDLPQKHIRQFTNVSEFLNKSSKYINGKIEKFLHPVFCYCERSFSDINNPIFKLDCSEENDIV